VQAACPAGGVVLDPFMGSGTTGMVAKTYGADFIGIEINPAYAELARQRIGEALFQNFLSKAKDAGLIHLPIKFEREQPPAEAQPALQEYNECMKSEDDVSPLERLRFFCSLAMNGQDWCDSEPFFDALEAQIAALAGTKEGEK
jgi:hypothetical protein